MNRTLVSSSTSGELKRLVRELYKKRQIAKQRNARMRIPLSVPSFGWKEILEALDSLLDANVTMGSKVKLFETLFSEYLATRYSIMVNSGSSANLLALSVLSNPTVENRIRPGDEIIVPAVTWSTTIFPIINIGAIPVLIDSCLEDFSMNVDEIEDAITERTRVIVPVHLLGFPCDMDTLMALAKRHDLFVVEDSCEAHGAMWGAKKVGTFGDIGTFSFYFSHHITTIEGGMLVTKKKRYAELARVLRAHGWVRELENSDKLAAKYPVIDKRYLFVNTGFNLRPTEIQGAFGIHQIKKLEKFIQIRRENARYWNEELSKLSDFLIVHEEKKKARAVWFGYPITIDDKAPFKRAELTRFLESRGIEVRPIAGGNMDEQPAMKIFNYKKINKLTNAYKIMRNSFFIGNHHLIKESERRYLIDCIKEFLSSKI